MDKLSESKLRLAHLLLGGSPETFEAIMTEERAKAIARALIRDRATLSSNASDEVGK